MTITTHLAAALLLSLAGLSPALADACKPAHDFDTLAKGKLTVALTNTPPYSAEKDGAISGIDGDLVTRFAKENCLDVTYEIYTYPAAVAAVQSGRADVAIGGFFRTAARDKVVTLSNPVYLDQVAVASKAGLSTVDELIGKKVGTVEGYAWVSEMEDSIDGSTTYPSSLNLAQDVQAGRLDAALEGFGAVVLLNAKSDVKVVLLKADPRISATTLASQTAFLLPKGNAGLVEAVNATLETDRSAGVIGEVLTNYGLDPSAAQVGDSRVIE